MTFEWREVEEASFAVIGDPVSHSLSPAMHNAAFAHLSLPYRYVAIHVSPGEVCDALDRLTHLGYRGVNVTVPHKEEALGWVDHLDPFARRVGAVNTIRMADRAAANTDTPGFLDTLDELGLKPGRPAVVLGAGGSARGVCVALAEAGFDLRIWNRTRARAEHLIERLVVPATVMETPDLAEAGLIVNTTSAALKGGALELDWSGVPGDAVAYDLMYGEPTPFLEGARASGLKTVDGAALLVAQGARSLEYWLDVDAPRHVMREAIA